MIAQMIKYRQLITESKRFSEDIANANQSIYSIVKFIFAAQNGAAVAVKECLATANVLLNLLFCVYDANYEFQEEFIKSYNTMAIQVGVAQETLPEGKRSIYPATDFAVSLESTYYCPNDELIKTLNQARDATVSVCTKTISSENEYYTAYFSTKEYLPQTVMENAEKYFAKLNYYFTTSEPGGFTPSMNAIVTTIDTWIDNMSTIIRERTRTR